jgi:twinkle protein
MGEFVRHDPCPHCKSSDGVGVYDDEGPHKCFVCNEYVTADGAAAPSAAASSSNAAPTDWQPVTGHYAPLPDRKLKEETLKFWKYQLGLFNGKPAHIMNIRDEHGKLIAQKFRTAETKGLWIGDAKDPPLYGSWLWGKGKSIVITEGELDALSVSQAWDNKWPVVSLPNGTGSVRKCLKRSYDYLSNFDKIILMFDQDDPGRKAVEDAVELLPAGKVYIATLPEKDANEVLTKHGAAPIVDAYWKAKQYRPDGIISGAEIDLDKLMSAATKGYQLRMPKLQSRLLGVRKGEITMLTAGSGIGKSTRLRQLCYELKVDHGCSIGNVYLEENNVKTAQAYVALDNDVPLGKLRFDPTMLTPEQWRASKEGIVNDMYFYNHFGSLDSARLIGKLHYMATVLKIDFIALDHISIVTSGLESSSEGERKDIDIFMTRLRSLVEETGVGVLAVVHLKRVQGKNFNEGSQVSLTDLRGSASLEQLSDNVLSLERNQQDEKKKDLMLERVLKCRETGDTGEADWMKYRRDTGKIVEAEVEEGFNATEEAEGAQKF